MDGVVVESIGQDRIPTGMERHAPDSKAADRMGYLRARLGPEGTGLDVK